MDQTVREWTIQERDRLRMWAGNHTLSEYQMSRLTEYNDQLKWFETDESKTVYEISDFMGDGPAIFFTREEAEIWNDDIDDDDEKYIIIERQMSGRYAGDMPMLDY